MGLSIQMGIKRNILFIRFNGELDHMTCESLKIRTCEILEKYYIKHLILNFEKLSFMDSSVIGYIIGRFSQLKKRSGKIVLCSINDLIMRLVNLSGLRKICLIARDEDEAQEFLEVA